MPFNAYALVWNISIHAPTRGATKYSFSIFRYVYFNPRSHEGSDGDRSFLVYGGLSISIHAPTRGATACTQWLRRPGCIFQSTLPRGERRGVFWCDCLCDNFNPRSHEGSDEAGPEIVEMVNDFNPRSHEGSDGTEKRLYQKNTYFNPRSHEGSDVFSGFSTVVLSISIHAPTRGATIAVDFDGTLHTDFNPRSHEGSDGILPGCMEQNSDFNPRSHEGSDTFLFKFCFHF